MTFSIFHSAEIISGCNSTVFGFTSFSPHYFKTLQLGFTVYHDSRFKKTGVDKARLSFKDCVEAIKGYYRRQKDVQFLKDRASWKSFSKIAQHNVALQNQLEQTQEDFQRHERFATHANESLLEAYEQLLNLEKLFMLGINDITAAKKRWFFGKVPDVVLEQFEGYLSQQLVVLKKEREDIVANILRRVIQVANDPFLENADTLPAVVKDLKSKGFLNANYTTPKITDDKLTKHLFLEFHAIVLSESQKEEAADVGVVLHALPWFNHKSSLAERFKVSDLMPRTKKRPAFLFDGSNTRYSWFADFHHQAKIDAGLHYLKTAKVTGELTFESLSHRLVVLHSAEQALGEEVRRVKQARAKFSTGIKKLFNHKTLTFLDKVESKLQEQAIVLVSEKIALLSFITITPAEEIQSLKLLDFVKDIEANISLLETVMQPHQLLTIRKQFSKQIREVNKTITRYFETHLKDYFCLWTELPRLDVVNEETWRSLNEKAKAQEVLLISTLPEEWASRIQHMQKLRESNQLRLLESAARNNLVELLGLKPSIVQHSIKKELLFIQETLVDYLKHKVNDFEYENQKRILAKMLEKIAGEGVCQAELSTHLSESQRSFLSTFPEVNFYLNIMLKIKQEETVLDKLYNPTEIEEHLNALYRFIQREEAKFLPKSNAKFLVLFSKSDVPSERRTLINQLKRGIL